MMIGLTAYDTDEDIYRAVKAGAKATSKDARREDLLEDHSAGSRR